MVSFSWGALYFYLCMPIGARTQWLSALSRVVWYRNPYVHCRSSCILFPALSSGLKFYVSFQTRCDIKNGTILQLAISPVNASSHPFFSVAVLIWQAVSCLRFSFSLHCTVRCTLLFSFMVVVCIFRLDALPFHGTFCNKFYPFIAFPRLVCYKAPDKHILCMDAVSIISQKVVNSTDDLMQKLGDKFDAEWVVPCKFLLLWPQQLFFAGLLKLPFYWNS